MRPSLFDRLTRYPVRPWMDPRENRLSASFAAVLEHAPDLARDLVANWFAAPRSRKLAVEVQHRIASGWIDVELRFGDPARPELLVWIEAKHGAGLSGADQLGKYRLELANERAERRILLLLTPVEFDVGTLDVVRVHEATPNDRRTHLASWQEVFARTHLWRASSSSDTAANWLVEEFLRFMKEEGLAERPISHDDVVALNRASEAEAALSAVLRKAEQLVTSAWGPRLEPARPTYSIDEYFRYRRHPRGPRRGQGWGDADLRWACESTDSAERETSVWAGLQSSVAGPLGREANDAWIRALESEDFTLEPDRRQRWLGRTMPLSELIQLATPEEQAQTSRPLRARRIPRCDT